MTVSLLTTTRVSTPFEAMKTTRGHFATLFLSGMGAK